MPSHMARERPREQLLACTLAELARPPVWLRVTCIGCGHITHLPCGVLAGSVGGAVRVREVIPRLRCGRCGARARGVAATSFPAGPPQYDDTWTVELAP